MRQAVAFFPLEKATHDIFCWLEKNPGLWIEKMPPSFVISIIECIENI